MTFSSFHFSIVGALAATLEVWPMAVRSGFLIDVFCGLGDRVGPPTDEGAGSIILQIQGFKACGQVGAGAYRLLR